jgi:inner membrane transporter RhtA
MCVEPAIALIIGLVVLHQVPGLVPVLGIVFVVVAGVGAERSGGRSSTDLPASAPAQEPAG